MVTGFLKKFKDAIIDGFVKSRLTQPFEIINKY